MKRTLITGVAGFIGSNLAHDLLAKGHHIVGVDNMSQGDKLNLEPLLKNPKFEMHNIDIRDEAALKKSAQGCKTLVHLAAYKIPRYTDALDTLLINSLGSENVLKVAIDQGAKVVAASTSDVYGKNPDVPFNVIAPAPSEHRYDVFAGRRGAVGVYHERHLVAVPPSKPCFGELE